VVLRLSRPVPWQQRFLTHLQRLITGTPNCNAVAPDGVVPRGQLQ